MEVRNTHLDLWPTRVSFFETPVNWEINRKPADEAESLRVERDGVLKAIRIDAPGFILDARLDFEREYQNSGGDGSFGQEMSPLVCFGYRVGS